ncbi:hypothetical protein [Jeotgalibacillus sp. JSM ZJ347]|uniref:hypothetical protein n=1 Tax=Jeotgalibacillus sp. JSM ZJ347 TaxID=3342117 RepID=UPI0035A99280
MMKKIFISLGIAAGVFIAGAGILFFTFVQSMKADPGEERYIEEVADEYLRERIEADTEIYDVLYDNMGNFPEFEYAANVRHLGDGTEFLVYERQTTGEVTDNYVKERMEDQIVEDIQPLFEQSFDRIEYIWVFLDEDTGKGQDPDQPFSYKAYNTSPFLMVAIPRNAQKSDGELFEKLYNEIKALTGFEQGTIEISYTDQGVPLEDDVWSKEF